MTTQHATRATEKSATNAISVPVPPATLFAFLAKPDNLPLWAVGFAHSVRHDGGKWIVRTAQGEIELLMPANSETGTIDFHMRVAPDIMAIAYSRVVSNGAGAEYVFTQFQTPGMPDEVFEAQVHALKEELNVLRSVVAARSACPA